MQNTLKQNLEAVIGFIERIQRETGPAPDEVWYVSHLPGVCFRVKMGGSGLVFNEGLAYDEDEEDLFFQFRTLDQLVVRWKHEQKED